ncbi:MAG: hypothetical protein P1V51_03785 [Deltaproteobacteria bacterium]|nr:hypothetical protein [Deltaproteobacteria bacterium]
MARAILAVLCLSFFALSLGACKTTGLSLNEVKSATTRPGGVERLAEKKAKSSACNESCQATYDECYGGCSESAETSDGDHACGTACDEARSTCLNSCRSAVN